MLNNQKFKVYLSRICANGNHDGNQAEHYLFLASHTLDSRINLELQSYA